MKHIIKFILITLLSSILFIWVDAGNIDLSGAWNIQDVSITGIWEATDTKNLSDSVNDLWFKLLTIAKVILQWVLLIYVVYIGFQMVLSLGTDEEELSQAKRQIRYALIWFIFVNIPWSLYNVVSQNNYGSINTRTSGGSWFSTPTGGEPNLFIDFFDFWQTFAWDIIGFVEVAIGIIAIFMLTLTGLQIIGSRGREDVLSEAKQKIPWTIVWLIFVWFIEAWKSFIFSGKVEDGINIFETLSELLLFFSGPVAIVFLTLAWYYYITANGDDERITKAKNIITNTLLATVILLASYAFLLDIAKL